MIQVPKDMQELRSVLLKVVTEIEDIGINWTQEVILLKETVEGTRRFWLSSDGMDEMSFYLGFMQVLDYLLQLGYEADPIEAIKLGEWQAQMKKLEELLNEGEES